MCISTLIAKAMTGFEPPGKRIPSVTLGLVGTTKAVTTKGARYRECKTRNSKLEKRLY